MEHHSVKSPVKFSVFNPFRGYLIRDTAFQESTKRLEAGVVERHQVEVAEAGR